MTAASTLTDRYIWAVQRSLPEAQRADIDRELRGTIADTIDGKRESGLDQKTAEREALIELGDPYRLAAGYADRPLQLIGPALFPSYIRLLKVLYAIVLPITAAAITLGLLLSQPESIGEVMGRLWPAVIGVAVHLGFWTTLVFAAIERAPQKDRGSIDTWNLDSLPELPSSGRATLGDAIGSVVFLVIMVGLLLWQQAFPVVVADDGTPLPMVNPDLWTLWLPVLFGIAVLEIGLAILTYQVGRWTVPLAIGKSVLAIVTSAILVWLFTTNQVIDSRWAAELRLTELLATGGVLAILAAFISAGIAVWTVIDTAMKTWRQRTT